MKLFLASILCFLLAISSSAQDSLVVSSSGEAKYYYKNGGLRSEGKLVKDKRNGLWKFYNTKGQLKTTETYTMGRLQGPVVHIDTITNRPVDEGNYDNGYQAGEWKYYFPSGMLKSKVWKDRGSLHGAAVYFDSTTGSLRSEGCHAKDSRNGVWRFYFNPPTHLYALETYKNGDLVGLAQYYDSVTFKLTSEGKHSNNVRDGVWTFYYSDGRLRSKETYKNGVLNGYAEFYDSLTAKKMEEGQFVNGLRHGKWQMAGEYDSLKKMMTVSYNNGILDGEYSLQTIGSNTTKQFGVTRSDGIHARTVTYYPGTSLTEFIEYTTHDKVDSVVYYDSASQRVTTVLPYRDEKIDGLVKFYYLNGNLQRKVNYKNGVKDGLCAEFDSTTGSRIALGYNTNGISSGRWHSYFINTNKICSEVSWENDSMNGPAVYFDSLTSFIIRTGQFKSDKREGAWKDFYAGTNKLKAEYGYSKSFLHGNYTEYDSSSGKKVVNGMYLLGKKEGNWNYYDFHSGQIIRQMRFSKGRLNGKVVEMDSNNNIVASCDYLDNEMHGAWEIYHPGSKQLMLRASLSHNTLDGSLSTFYPSGKRKRIEEYKNDSLKSGSCFDEEGKEIDCYPFLQEASYSRDEMNYIANSIRYPKEAEKIKREGEVLVGFYINEDGRISEAGVLKGIGAGCDDEALRVINSMRPWNPAMVDGIPFRQYVILPVNFKIVTQK